MLNYPDVIMLGLGHRARNGKDSFANILKGTDENIKIIHWADGVYEQCTNKDSEHPLIKLELFLYLSIMQSPTKIVLLP